MAKLFGDQKAMVFFHHFSTHYMYWTLVESKNDDVTNEEFLKSGMAFRDLEGVVWIHSSNMVYIEDNVKHEIKWVTEYYDSIIIELKS